MFISKKKFAKKNPYCIFTALAPDGCIYHTTVRVPCGETSNPVLPPFRRLFLDLLSVVS
jgi:hypothetical protein